ncbi:DNA endonuclease SmrA [Permianibacter fluminis]|uniref:DNA endonuclease SmrA n=1 Tax=Permianibacter fluminis TaxID=2738515 RepID=UPI001B7D85CC|nr:DNA endonuclease SmrA [Permianibacter fluminis]
MKKSLPPTDELELFRAELADVTPLASDAEVAVSSAPDLDAIALEARRLAAITDRQHDSNFLSTAEPPLVDPYAEIGYRHDGVQLGVYQALRGGKYESRYVLDLHRRTVEQARNDVFHFIQDAVKREQRCVLILHGRGVRAPIPALLKSYVNVWLQQLPDVLAFHSAQKRDGGTGALYVLLKKSDDAKQENRERFGTR